jgi:3-hydroxyisobutyrate dehydrogenase-like beta-hydroxyacid dehydrogenase
MTIRAGFIGLGNIGLPMAQKLLEARFETTVYDVQAPAMDELTKSGARAGSSARDVASRADVVGICVRDDADVLAVALGPEGVLAGAARGAVVALHSTILPRTVHEVARAAAERGVGVLDAPITGGAFGARQGTLTYMVGGDTEVLERCRPVFAASAAHIIHAGPLGSGAAVKLCNNLMTYLGFLAAFEATLLAKTTGLSQEALQAVTRSNGNMNDAQVMLMATREVAEAHPEDAALQGHLRGFADLAEKDLALTLAFAREHGVALPGTGLCQQLMARVYGVRDGKRR